MLSAKSATSEKCEDTLAKDNLVNHPISHHDVPLILIFQIKLNIRTHLKISLKDSNIK